MRILRAVRSFLSRSETPSAPVERPALLLRQALGESLWTADRADIRGDRLTFTGWVISPTDDPNDVAFVVNGRRCDQVQLAMPRLDLSAVFGFVPGAERAGFAAEAQLTDAEARGETPIEIDAADPRTLAPLRPWQFLSCLPGSCERWPLPDESRIKRVHGAPDESSFRLVGYSNFRKLERVLDTRCGRRLVDFDRVLDWGCGSGRLLRYLGAVEGLPVTGADIDHDNLAWCREHLPFASYVHLPLHPPSALPERSFDLVIGMSIFTHLSESVQFEWLLELARVSAPGATLLMSIHGPTVHATTQSVAFCEKVRERGIVDGRSHDLDDVLEDKSYYRTTHHAHDYVRREWSRHFDIVDILPACIGNMQDLVVMRRPV